MNIIVQTMIKSRKQLPILIWLSFLVGITNVLGKPISGTDKKVSLNNVIIPDNRSLPVGKADEQHQSFTTNKIPGTKSLSADRFFADKHDECTSSNLKVGIILSPTVIRSQNEPIEVRFSLTNVGQTALGNVNFTGQQSLFKERTVAGKSTKPIALTLQGDVNNDQIMQPGESWQYVGVFLATYSLGDVFLIAGGATATCDSVQINAETADLLYTVSNNMDVIIKDKCYQPGRLLEVDLITRLLIDEDAATNPGSVTLAGGTVINLPKRRFEGRNLMILIQGLNNDQPFDPFNPPAGIPITRFTDQGGVDGGRNTNNVLDELEPVNTVRAPCTSSGQDDVGCEFPDWGFHIQIPVPANYSGNSFSVTASDVFQLFQAIETPAGSGIYGAFSDITPGTGAGGADTDIVPGCFDLALTKKISSGQASVFRPGETVKFTVTVYNQGAVPAYNVGVIDYIPSGLTLADNRWTAGANNTASLTLTGPIAVGGSAIAEITFKVNNGVTGDLINKTEITTADDDQNPANTPPSEVNKYALLA